MPLSPYVLSLPELDAVRARVAAASPGPWHALSGARRYGAPVIMSGVAPVTPAYPLVLANTKHVLAEVSAWIEDADRDFIVNARSDVGTLLAEVDCCHEMILGANNWRKRLANRLDLPDNVAWSDILDAVDILLDNNPNLEE